MPTKEDLMGLGVNSLLANETGYTPQSLNGAGTTQAAATAILSTLALVTASGGATGARLPSDAKIGTPFYVISVSGTAAVIYCPVGHTLNGTSNGGATFSAATGMLVFIRVSSTAWYVTGTATATVA